MSRGINKCIFIGNLFADPEVRYGSSGNAIANARLAVNETWKDKIGLKQERVESIRLVFFGRLAEIAQQYLRKGAKIYVEGRMQTRKWQDQDGQDRYSTEIVVDHMQMLGGKSESSGGGNYNAPTTKEQAKSEEFDDMDIPFATNTGIR